MRRDYQPIACPQADNTSKRGAIVTGITVAWNLTGAGWADIEERKLGFRSWPPHVTFGTGEVESCFPRSRTLPSSAAGGRGLDLVIPTGQHPTLAISTTEVLA